MKIISLKDFYLYSLFTIFLVLLFFGFSLSKTIYLSPIGQDNAECGSSIETACKTINISIVNAQGGNIIILPGNYSFDGEITLHYDLFLTSYNLQNKSIVDATGFYFLFQLEKIFFIFFLKKEDHFVL
jgi:hypothetical protein